jgi:hypothetical protein
MGLGSEIRDPDKNLFLIPDLGPGSKKAPKKSRIRIRNTGCFGLYSASNPIEYHSKNIHTKK